MKGYRGAALCMAMLLSLTACGNTPAGPTDNTTTASETGEKQMGRWVESEVELNGREIAGGPTLLDDGSLVMFAYEQDPSTLETGPVSRLTSTDNGETWTEDNPGWSDQTDGFINQIWVGGDGTACMSSVVLDSESRADNSYHFYLQKDGGTLEELQVEGFENIRHVVFYQGEALLFQQSYGEYGVSCEMTAHSLATGETRKVTLDGDAMYGAGIEPTIAGDKLLYLYYAETSMPLMELNPQDGISTQVMDTLSEAVSSAALVGDSEGAVYYPTPKGIYRLAPGGTLPEQVVPADGTAMSVNSNYPTSICRAANGDFLVMLAGDDSTRKVYRYHYDETLPAHSETTLSVWSLEDSATARAAINLYKQKHPEVDVTFTVAISDDAQDPAAARNDALTQLNTELLAGNGPDLLILDGVNYETYAEKGLLADISDTLPLAELQQNLTEPFVKDGKVYAMPARFTVPVLIGDDGTLDALGDLDAMQQAVMDAAPRGDFGADSSDYYEPLPDAEKYALRLTSAEDFAEFLLPVTASAILNDNTINEDALGQVMEFVETVSDYYGIKDYTKKEGMGSAQGWSGTDTIAINPEQSEYTDSSHAKYGWFNMDTPYSVLAMARKEDRMDYSSPDIPCDIMLRPGLVSGAYTPKTLVGVNAGSEYLDLAKELAAAFFDPSVQDTFYSDGMTVRADCLAAKLDAVVNNEYYPSDSFTGDIKELLNSCTTPVLVPELLRSSFLEHADAVIQGEENAADAANGIKADLDLYLAEQQ